MALKANAIINVADAKLFLTIPTVETSFDSILENFINECSEMIERYCGRIFIKKTLTEKYSGNGSRQIMTRNWPIAGITSIHDSLERVFDSSSLVASSNYEAIKNEMYESYLIERYDRKFSNGRQNIQIVYDAGYEASNLPSDIKLACKISVAFYYTKQQQKDWTQAVKSKGDENISIIQGLPKSAVDILNIHKRLEVLGED